MEDFAEETSVSRLCRPHVGPVRLDPRAERNIVVDKARNQQGLLVRWCRHVGVGEYDEVGVDVEHPGSDRGTFAAVCNAEETEGRPIPSPPYRFGPCLDECGGVVCAPVVDDEDVDVIGQSSSTAGTVASTLPAPME